MRKEGNIKGAILVFGGSKEKRLILITSFIQKLGFDCSYQDKTPLESLTFPNSPDFLRIFPEEEKLSIGIEEAKKIVKFLSQKPYEKTSKLVLVENARYLTIQAQNALLKTLEELPDFATIILECGKQNELLETVVSRCQRFFAGGKRSGEIKPLGVAWTKIKKLPPKSKLDLAEKLAQKERGEVVAILENWIAWEKMEIIGANTTKDDSGGNELDNETMNEPALTGNLAQHAKNLQVLAMVWEDLKLTNVNLGMALDFLLLSLK